MGREVIFVVGTTSLNKFRSEQRCVRDGGVGDCRGGGVDFRGMDLMVVVMAVVVVGRSNWMTALMQGGMLYNDF